MALPGGWRTVKRFCPAREAFTVPVRKGCCPILKLNMLFSQGRLKGGHLISMYITVVQLGTKL